MFAESKIRVYWPGYEYGPLGSGLMKLARQLENLSITGVPSKKTLASQFGIVISRNWISPLLSSW